MPSGATFAGNGFGGLTDEIVVLAGAAILTGNGFRRLSHLIVVSVVLASAAMLTRGLSYLLVVLAGAAIVTGNGFRRLPQLIVVSIVLAGAAFVATGNVIIHSRSILSHWTSFTSGCVRKWV